MRYTIELSYDGTNFNGWQRQKNTSKTIQEIVETAISSIFSQEIELVGCGRTDANVHAQNYIAHFDLDSIIIDSDDALYKLNQIVGNQIVIHNISKVSTDFHARFDAKSRSYEYTLITNKNPFNLHYAYYYKYKKILDIDLLNQIASLLIGKHNFNCFCKSGSDVNNTFCEVYSCEWILDKTTNQYFFRIDANRFLRGMIRLIVGACLNVERGKLTIKEIEYSLLLGERLSLDWSVPANGLILKNIVY